jgi:hypothetical protein
LLSLAALGVAVAVLGAQVLLSDHHDAAVTAMRLGGAVLLTIAAALFASIVPPAPARARR